MAEPTFNLRDGIGVRKTVVLTLDGNACYMLKKLLAAAEIAIRNDPGSFPSITREDSIGGYSAMIADLETVL